MRLPDRRTLLVGVAAGVCLGVLAWSFFAVQPRRLPEAQAHAVGLKLVEAARVGNAAVARALVNDGADINATGVDGTSALHWAVHLGDIETARLLIAQR